MTKHTSGKWKIKHEGLNGYILTTNFKETTTENQILESEANARLIAAAPELLKACIELLVLPNNALIKEKAREAIAKANGE